MQVMTDHEAGMQESQSAENHTAMKAQNKNNISQHALRICASTNPLYQGVVQAHDCAWEPPKNHTITAAPLSLFVTLLCLTPHSCMRTQLSNNPRVNVPFSAHAMCVSTCRYRLGMMVQGGGAVPSCTVMYHSLPYLHLGPSYPGGHECAVLQRVQASATLLLLFIAAAAAVQGCLH
jgi:hypothetical protein